MSERCVPGQFTHELRPVGERAEMVRRLEEIETNAALLDEHGSGSLVAALLADLKAGRIVKGEP